MTNRTYHFQLPYDVSGLQDQVGVSDLQSAGLWHKVPAALQARMTAGEGLFGRGVEVTKADLDALPNDVWAYVAQKLDLSWS